MSDAPPPKEPTNSTDKGGSSSSLSEAEKFLESLNLESQEAAHDSSSKPRTSADHKDIMSFLDEIAQYPADPSEQTTETNKGAVVEEKQQPVGSSSAAATQQEQQQTKEQAAAAASNTATSTSSWAAWGSSLWNQASAAVKTTTEQINRSVAAGSDSPAAKLLEDRVKHLQELVNKESLGKIGNELRNLTHTILETVAPPISEHELVEVWLSHDMVGYVGLEALVYRAFARVMEQTESGHVVVRKVGDKEDQRPEDETFRDLNMCEGITQGLKLAKANVDNLIKLHYVAPEARTEYTPQAGAVPVINCPVFLAIQPVRFSPLQLGDDAKSIVDDSDYQVVFVVMLVDPTHQISFKTYSQSIPLPWLDVPYEDNEWVEEKVTEVIRMAVTTIAQDYVWTRMTGATTQLAKAVAASSQEGKAESQQGAAEKNQQGGEQQLQQQQQASKTE